MLILATSLKKIIFNYYNYCIIFIIYFIYLFIYLFIYFFKFVLKKNFLI